MLLLLASLWSMSQTMVMVDSSHQKTSFRGLSVVNEHTVWVSGSGGNIGRSTDGGKTWNWVNPAGFEKRDFRDIEAFDETTAIAMAVDNPALILKTTDGGRTWNKVFEKDAPGMFLDAIDFSSSKNGICIGDPMDGRFYIITTKDGGNSWQEISFEKRPESQVGEALFAASGTNIHLETKQQKHFAAIFVTGGSSCRLHFLGGKDQPNSVITIPIQQGQQMTGANSILDLGNGYVVVGGDYNHPLRSDSAFFVYDVYGTPPSSELNSPQGYLSCATAIDGKVLVCGLRGVSAGKLNDKAGSTKIVGWQTLSTQAFHVIKSVGKAVFAAGPNGKIARISW